MNRSNMNQHTRLDALEKEVHRHSKLIEQMQSILEQYARILDKILRIFERGSLVRNPADIRDSTIGEALHRSRKSH